ncbi:MAG TPA: transglycosylase domain-containing protein, partial [Humisphaera sp.]
MAAFEAAVRLLPYPPGIDRPPPAATLLLDRDGRPLAAFAAADGRWHLPLSPEQVSPHLLDAIVAVEDGRFRDHAGVDWAGVGGAARDTMLGRRRGASTITMQLQRLRDPRPRGWLAKLDQAVRARQIERAATKDAILAEYVNRAPFGGALVGAGAASWRYFGKPCRDLSLGEAALLAGLPQNPNAFRPDRHPEAALRRRTHVLARMRALGRITAAQQADADAEPLTAAWRPLPQERPVVVQASAHASTKGTQAEARATTPTADGALAALLARSFQQRGGTVVTAIDARTQRLAADVAAEQLRSLAASGVSAAAVVVLDTRTAEVLATVSLELKDGRPAASRIDLAQRPRSTGSVLKPFIYAAAFDAGTITPQTVLRDEPAAWAAYVPANYDRTFAGDMPAAEALARSRNVPALAVLERVGVGRAVGVMEGLGVATPARAARPVGLSLAVGGAEASVTEVAQAF